MTFFVVAVCLLGPLSYFTLEGTVDLWLCLLAFAGLATGLIYFHFKGIPAIVAVWAVLTIAAYVLTSGCTRGCFGSQAWVLASETVAPGDVLELCIDDDCAVPSNTTRSPGLGTEVTVREPQIESASETFIIAGSKVEDRTYRLKLTLRDGSVIKAKVNPKLEYCYSKRCSTGELSFYFPIERVR